MVFESHITIEPVFGEERDLAELVAKVHGFRLAKLFMLREKSDSSSMSTTDTFMTGHDKEFVPLKHRMLNLIEMLKERGFVVRRYKIEQVLLDSRVEDELEVL